MCPCPCYFDHQWNSDIYRNSDVQFFIRNGNITRYRGFRPQPKFPASRRRQESRSCNDDQLIIMYKVPRIIVKYYTNTLTTTQTKTI